MRKKVDILRHLSVLFLTILIFTIGVFIGSSVEEARVQNLYTNLQQQDLNYQSLITEGRYLDYLLSIKNLNSNNTNNSCSQIKGAYYTSIKNLDDSRLKLETYINNGKVKLKEFDRLKDHYANLQIDYWILANKINNNCKNTMNTILYFYSEKKKCPACEDQGVHLNYVKQKLKDNILIFSLDSQKKGTSNLLAQKYGVYQRELPVLVIGEKVYGFKTNAQIFNILNISNN